MRGPLPSDVPGVDEIVDAFSEHEDSYSPIGLDIEARRPQTMG